MKYLDDKRKGLTGQQTTQQLRPQTTQTVKTQTVSTPQKTAAAPVQTTQTQAAPKVMEQHGSAQGQSQTQTPAQTAPSAADQAQAILSQQPGAYKSKWGSSIDDVLAQLMNPQEFAYDPATDPLYLMLRSQAAQNGKLAMEDTMGIASQLTGGYGNSHAQMLGQQVYSGYLNDVNAMIPDLKQAAREEYDAANDALLQKLGLMMDQENQDYGRYLDEIERQRYDDELAYSREQDALANERYESETAYNRQQDAYDRLLEMIVTTGYKPSAEELAAAGMSESQYKAWLGYWQGQQAGSGGSGGGGGSRGSGGGGGDGEPVGNGGNPTVPVLDQYRIMAGNGTSKEDLLASANEDRADGTITEQEYAQLVAWINSLDDTPNEPVKSGYTGRGSRDLGMPLHTYG